MKVKLWNIVTNKYVVLNEKNIWELDNLSQFPIISSSVSNLYVNHPMDSRAIDEIKNKYLDWCNRTNTGE